MNLNHTYFLRDETRAWPRHVLHTVLLPLLLLFSPSKVFSNEPDSALTAIFTLIYNQQFSEAEKALEENRPVLENFRYNMLKLDLSWWKFSLSKSKADERTFKLVLDEFYNTFQNTRDDKLTGLICTSYKMRYEIKRYNLIAAFFLRSEVREQIEVIKRENLTFQGDRQKLFEFYQALFGYFDQIINPFSFGKKSEEYLKSLAVLEKNSNDNDFILSTMAHYFLGRIYLKVENQPEKGKNHFLILSKRFPKNSLFNDITNGTNTRF